MISLSNIILRENETMNRNELSIILLIIAVVIALVLIVCLIRFVVTRHLEKSTAAYQNKLLKNQIDEVHNVYMIMRGWRHDYHNHMQSLKAYLEMDNIKEARDYLDKLETDLDDINLNINWKKLEFMEVDKTHEQTYYSCSRWRKDLWEIVFDGIICKRKSR